MTTASYNARPSSSLDGFILRRLQGSAARRWSICEESLKSSSTKATEDSSISTWGGDSDRSQLCVSFQEEPSVLLIPSIAEEDKDALFYSQDDQDDLMDDAEMVATGWSSGPEDTDRGLERFSTEGRKVSQEQRHNVISAVLEEQRRLQEESFVFGVDQQKVLAKVSRRLSADCQDMAYRRAYQDELDSVPRQTTTKQPVPQQQKPGLLSRVSTMILMNSSSHHNKGYNR
ncbi:expressed unknown protein [Seminavis robusta]|uniref:Uncharacterized protein n=1 Tax=Seminavis robusta TaxID=568900 RepID=A0A9N8EDX0_9STRA|nr:expressed unknown protein [Seminavis robusta]|eukprot:Sro860_g212090.1 n/a (230) ;mRNA; r:1384-2073